MESPLLFNSCRAAFCPSVLHLIDCFDPLMFPFRLPCERLRPEKHFLLVWTSLWQQTSQWPWRTIQKQECRPSQISWALSIHWQNLPVAGNKSISSARRGSPRREKRPETEQGQKKEAEERCSNLKHNEGEARRAEVVKKELRSHWIETNYIPRILRPS